MKLVVIGVDVIASPVFFACGQIKRSLLCHVECPVWHIDTAETVNVLGILQLLRSKNRLFHHRAVSLLTVLLGLLERDDVIRPALMADSAVQNGGGAAKAAEACCSIVCT